MRPASVTPGKTNARAAKMIAATPRSARAHQFFASESMFMSVSPTASLQRSQKRHEIPFFVRRELRAEDQVEEFHRVLKGQQAAIVQIGRRVLDATEREGLDGSVG